MVLPERLKQKFLRLSGMKGVFRIVALFVLPVLLLILWTTGALLPKVKTGHTPLQGQEVTGVQTYKVQNGSGTLHISATGTVRPMVRALIASKIMARVTSVNFHEGSQVTAGADLCLLDDRDLSAQTAQAAAGVQSALAGEQAQAQGIKQAEAGLEKARADYQLSETNFNRYKFLQSQGAVSQADFDRVQNQYQQAKSALDNARATLDSAVAQVKVAGAQVTQSQANLQYAQAVNSYSRISAPLNGIIVKKMVDVGSMVTPGQPVAEEEQGPYRLEVPVPESYYHQIRVGDQVTVDIPALNRQFVAKVDEIVPAVESSSMTYLVKILLPQDLNVKSGMYGDADFALGSKREMTIPAAAVVKWGDFTGVYILRNDVARLSFVTLGEEQGDKVQVLSGLNPGDVIVAGGTARVHDGDRVKGGLINE
ncbi:efflux RND transporter periplasmic adaptor subunit [Desulfotomaculum copahuensis]|uniref:Uncharacterized protein n=1 Tax=Desulfotomaculum copahuensis TaxID=1838280 RepID=A0A1B7LBH9_9FIRM|nr:efflux RND transporter periplasmic adaptor subunit [Desulfotomaculum copahuensis]OAT79809.1 hypothetical protein A6M21_15285 [Desulfotomaculum copahuensis]